MTVDWAIILSMLGIIGGGTGIAAIIVAITSRKKTKADATKIIQEAAAAQVCRMQEEVNRWQAECHELRGELNGIRGRVEENESCQTILKVQIEQLQREKKELLYRVEVLERENARLRGRKESP